ncbi:hypothetical protein THAOC_07890 [Thalassiosira oceanica]|uniref:Uncharacterized protein n=2 Tax=Thalassiosira oceanica TaxID=159749 RepID=K0SWH0_THAOC|nr:hypothetical protein THAOC_07890 [Thalassiosira oceanica]|eukprot:EJK70728.1 hypothetical protein THAOC_07890 [Thalassiosira oceanica]
MVSKEEVAEINTYFQNRMAESKKIWAARGPEARVAAAAKPRPQTWRQMSGLSLMAHEASHIGNRPFMVGFGVCALGALYIQTKFTDEMKEDSLYWSTYHLKKTPERH